MTETSRTAVDSLTSGAQTAESLASDLLVAGGILSAFLLTALLVRLFWMRVLRPLVRRTGTDLDDLLLPPLRVLVVWGLVLIGLHESLASLSAVRASAQTVRLLGRALGVAGASLAVWTALRVFNRLTSWYVRRAAERPERARDISTQAALVRKAGNVLLSAVGLLYVLRTAGLDISPLLAGGAVGGLAVALALQDTLSNLFAGFYLTIDRPVKVGDFVKLESGDEGFVEEIGWRNTKVRLWANNLVVIPNSKLSQSVITNYFLPEQETSVYVWCGVSYDSDLQRVEDVTVDVARQVMREVEGADAQWEPLVRWKEFGDFAITFLTVLRVKTFDAQYLLHSEFIKALHRRFREEGIEIPFPVRTVIVKQAEGENGGALAGERKARQIP
jgi:small-conductance mechanosensitive channel